MVERPQLGAWVTSDQPDVIQRWNELADQIGHPRWTCVQVVQLGTMALVLISESAWDLVRWEDLRPAAPEEVARAQLSSHASLEGL